MKKSFLIFIFLLVTSISLIELSLSANGIEATVKSYYDDYTMVLSAGFEKGIKEGDIYSLRLRGQEVAQVEVVWVSKNFSRVRVVVQGEASLPSKGETVYLEFLNQRALIPQEFKPAQTPVVESKSEDELKSKTPLLSEKVWKTIRPSQTYEYSQPPEEKQKIKREVRRTSPYKEQVEIPREEIFPMYPGWKKPTEFIVLSPVSFADFNEDSSLGRISRSKSGANSLTGVYGITDDFGITGTYLKDNEVTAHWGQFMFRISQFPHPKRSAAALSAGYFRYTDNYVEYYEPLTGELSFKSVSESGLVWGITAGTLITKKIAIFGLLYDFNGKHHYDEQYWEAGFNYLGHPNLHGNLFVSKFGENDTTLNIGLQWSTNGNHFLRTRHKP